MLYLWSDQLSKDVDNKQRQRDLERQTRELEAKHMQDKLAEQ
jgi:hypothetical protein